MKRVCGLDSRGHFQWTAPSYIHYIFVGYYALHLPERLGEANEFFEVVVGSIERAMTEATTWTRPLPAAQAGAEHPFHPRSKPTNASAWGSNPNGEDGDIALPPTGIMQPPLGDHSAHPSAVAAR